MAGELGPPRLLLALQLRLGTSIPHLSRAPTAACRLKSRAQRDQCAGSTRPPGMGRRERLRGIDRRVFGSGTCRLGTWLQGEPAGRGNARRDARLQPRVCGPIRRVGAGARVTTAIKASLRAWSSSSRSRPEAALADLPKLRQDSRWESIVSPAASGIASADIDGYLAADNVDAVSRDHLLIPADVDANVVMHVLPEGQKPYGDSTLLLAVDLADQRGPREELRAAELLREVAVERQAVKR